MDIQKLTTGYQTKTYATNENTKTTNTSETEDTTVNQSVTEEDTAVVVEKNPETVEDTKKDYTVDQKALDKLYNEHEQKTKQFLELVNTLFKKQADTNKVSLFGSQEDFENNIQAFKEGIQNGTVEVDQATIDKAKEDVAEDGYYGVEKTSDRLVDFAKAISGGDPEKIELLRDAVVKGFQQAEELWGDELPQISKDTFTATMDKFDAWAKESGVTLTEIEKW